MLLSTPLFEPRNPDFPYEAYPKFDLEEMAELECLAEFRFKKRDISLLAEVLEIPPTLQCDQKSICVGIEDLCMLLRRLSYPSRYGDLIQRFAKPVSVYSMVTNILIDYIYDIHGQRLTHWNPAILNPDQLETYAAAITSRGSPLHNCFGFIDGTTVRPIARPGENQRILYNGHKRIHAIKFQSVVLPNGLIGSMYGPVEGRKHDACMLTDSGLLQDLQHYAFSHDGQPMCLYGDPAYPLRVHLHGPFRFGDLTNQMKAYKTAMSTVRSSVEWLIGDINFFKFLDFKKNLKIGLSSIGKMYIVSALLQNALTCLNGNLTSTFFAELDPPTLKEYFS